MNSQNRDKYLNTLQSQLQQMCETKGGALGHCHLLCIVRAQLDKLKALLKLG